jgi:hypothetical protein
MEMLPIDPLLTPSGAFAALATSFGDEATRPVALDASDKPLADFSVFTGHIAISTAAKLNIATIFSGSAQHNEQAYYFDAAAFTDKWSPVPIPGSIVYGTRWGIGMRIALRVWDIKGDFSGSFGAVAAAVQLGVAKARYEIRGFGLGVDGLTLVLESLSTLSDFSYETYYKISNQVIAKLTTYIRDNKQALIPVPIAVALSSPLDVDPIAQSEAVVFAARQIRGAFSLKQTLDSRGKHDESIVRRVYAAYLGEETPETVQPTGEQKARANNWLKSLQA